jgi:hypothetical protein
VLWRKWGRYAATPACSVDAVWTMPQLAYAYLALADDDHHVSQRTVPRMVAAAAAAVVLAVGAPLGFLVVHDHPIGPLTSKFALTDDD